MNSLEKPCALHSAQIVLSKQQLPGVWVRITLPRRIYFQLRGIPMNLTVVSIGPLIALIAGILILVMPRLLNYIVALYLIIVGVLGLVAPYL